MLEQTCEKLWALGMKTMATVATEQAAQAGIAELAFEERLGLLVDREWDARETRRLGTRLKAAQLKQPAGVEDIDFVTPRGLDRGVVLSLAGGHWIAAHQHLIVSGPTGAGKTFIACALGNAACRRGYTVAYRRVSRLLEELALARDTGALGPLCRRLARRCPDNCGVWGAGADVW
ncbi:MAG: ATP-binding protein, partial [Clostridia bacterium]